MTKPGDWTGLPGGPPPTGCGIDSTAMGQPTECETCKCPPDSGQTTVNQQNDDGNCSSSSCSDGSYPGFLNSPANALDRALSYANRGRGQYLQISRGLESVGASCGVDVKVDLTTGNVRAQIKLPSVGPFGPDTALTYNSTSQEPTDFGYGWTNMLRQSVSMVGSSQADVVKGTRKKWSYTGLSGGDFVPPTTTNNTLSQVSGGFVERQPNGFQLEYKHGTPQQLSALIDIRGNRWTLTYSGSQIAEITGPAGRLTTFTYDVHNHIQAITDHASRVTNFSVNNTSGNLVSVTSPEMCETQFSYDNNHNLTGLTLPVGQKITYSYDVQDRLSSVNWPSGGFTTYQYLSDPDAGTIVTDPLGQITTFQAAAGGADDVISAVTDPLGNVSQLGTGADSLRMSAVADARGYVTTYTYNSTTTGRAEQIQTIQLPRGGVFTYNYDINNRIESVQDCNGNLATIHWNATFTMQRDSLEDPLGYRTTYSYNGNNQITEIWDALNRRTTRAYDSNDNLSSVTNPLGQIVTYSYNANNQLETTQDPLGNVTTQLRDDMNRVTQMIDPLGRITTTSYNDNGQVLTVTDPRGHTTTNHYDDALTGRLLAVENALGQRMSYTYDVASRVVSVTNALGNINHTIYDPAGRGWYTIDPLGNTTTFGYDAAGNRQSVMDPLSRVSTTIYDGENAVRAQIDPLGRTTTYGYDLMGNPKTVTDPLGNVTTSMYNERLWLHYTQDPLGNTTTFVYDPVGQRIATQDPLGRYTTLTYDLAGRTVSMTNALGQISHTIFDAAGRRIASVDPLGYRTTTGYDAASQLISMTNALGYMTTFAYDPNGNQTSVTDPLGNTRQSAFDELNRILAQIDALNNRTTFVYDAIGQRVEVKDARGNSTFSGYDAASRLVSMTDPLGFATTLNYDQASQLKGLQDANGNVTTFNYDLAGQLASEIDPLSRVTTFSYDRDGRPQTKLDPRGTLITYSYDAVGRQTLRNRSDGVRVTYSYDGVGNRLTMADSVGRTTYSYDALNRPLAINNAHSKMVTYQYDPRGLRSQLVDPDGGVTTYSYDGNRRLSWLQNAPGEFTTFTYDVADRRQTQRLGNGVLTTFSYDAANQVTTIAHANASGANLITRGYQYDPVGNRTVMTQVGTTARVTWTYDAANQLTAELSSFAGATSPHHGYDPAGNRLTQLAGQAFTYTYDVANQLQTGVANTLPNASQWTTYTYDAAGNRAKQEFTPGVGASFVTTYTWDAENRLVHFAGQDPLTLDNQYDGDGRRVERLANSASDPQTRRFVWDGENILAETDETGATQIVNTYEPRQNGNLLSARIWDDPDWTRCYPLIDALGSIIRLTDDSAGALNNYTYQAFGATVASTFNEPYPFAWIGQVGYYTDALMIGAQDTTTAVPIIVRNRWYDPATIVWLSKDLIGFHGGDWNLYRYVANAPNNHIDPSGDGGEGGAPDQEQADEEPVQTYPPGLLYKFTWTNREDGGLGVAEAGCYYVIQFPRRVPLRDKVVIINRANPIDVTICTPQEAQEGLPPFFYTTWPGRVPSGGDPLQLYIDPRTGLPRTLN